MKGTRILNGYRVVYEPNHPTAMKNDNWKGYVYEHILVVELRIKRSLSKDECVHHLDCDRSNNHSNNLIVISNADHKRLHLWIDQGLHISKDYKANGLNSNGVWNVQAKYCAQCKKAFSGRGGKYCSFKCSNIYTEKNINDNRVSKFTKPSKEELHKLIWSKSTIKIAKDIGCSDKCIEKWCKSYALTKPARGFWQQLEANKFLGQSCPL